METLAGVLSPPMAALFNAAYGTTNAVNPNLNQLVVGREKTCSNQHGHHEQDVRNRRIFRLRTQRCRCFSSAIAATQFNPSVASMSPGLTQQFSQAVSKTLNGLANYALAISFADRRQDRQRSEGQITATVNPPSASLPGQAPVPGTNVIMNPTPPKTTTGPITSTNPNAGGAVTPFVAAAASTTNVVLGVIAGVVVLGGAWWMYSNSRSNAHASAHRMKNPISKNLADAIKLRKKLYAYFIDSAEHGNNAKLATFSAIKKLTAQVKKLAARVRPSTADDHAWDFYDKDMVEAEDLYALERNWKYVFGKLHSAVGMIAGAAERDRANVPEFEGYYTSRLRPGGQLIAWPVKLLNKGDFYHVRGLGGRFKGQTFSIVPSEYSTYVPTGARVMR